jgi:SAM-dependent methyltransferase
MNEHEYQKMFEMENRYWWFIGRRKLVDWLITQYSALGGKALLFDLGCGTGRNLQHFSQHGRVVGGDCAVAALDSCRKHDLTNVFGCQAEAIPLKSGSVDVVTALDVLEHIREDMTAVQEVYRILKPGGLFVALVPAYGFLWSEHDEALHHFRRYVAGELRAKLVAAGFVLERVSYYIFFLFFPILLFRLWQGLNRTSISPAVSYREPPIWINEFFVWLLTIERYMLRFINIPFGVSLLAVSRKPWDREKDQN